MVMEVITFAQSHQLEEIEPTTIEDREQPLHPKPEDPKLTRNAYKEQQVPPPPTSRHGLHRMRSRSFAATTEKPGLVRARTEALMAASASTATLSPVSPSAGLARSGKMLNTSSTMAMSSAAIHKSPSSMLNRPVSPSLKGVSSKPDIKADASNKLAPPMEDDRPSYFRHGRQRSNTVGEAVTFPAVSVTSSPSSPANRRSSMQPDSGSCLKCFEKVVENGVKLPNGDRYHIQCFLCTGCKQIFTESEFHIVNGRPYHPQCSVMAGSTSTMSATTKCAKCLKLVSKRTIRFGGMNYHPQCFTCSHCNQVLQSTSKFFEVDGKVECERCCEEKDRQRLPQMVPLPRSTESSFPTATSPVVRRQSQYGMATNAATSTIDTTRPRMHGSTSPTGEPVGDSSSLQGLDHRPQSPTASSLSPGPMSSTNHMSPMAPRVDPPVLTSLFSTRTRPLPRFGGTVTCPRCKQPIGVMDQTPGPKGEKWHKKCLNCKGCKKVLDSSALTLGEGEAYCRACYNKATKA
ncbi:Cysteine and glycine-rich protein 1 [Actinomortierella ambigua]|nr:Cysteine and glycine-rich protein 1 [Actinomortierella ambigua]